MLRPELQVVLLNDWRKNENRKKREGESAEKKSEEMDAEWGNPKEETEMSALPLSLSCIRA